MNPVILVPTDFSEAANHAMHFAVSLANVVRQEIVLLHVFQAQTTAPYEVPLVIEEELVIQKIEVDEQLAQWCHAWQPLCEMPLKHLSLYGEVHHTVQQVAAKKRVSFIVMGTNGQENIWEKFWGTNTYHIVKDAICPVFVVPKAITINAIEKMVYASDYTHNELLMLSVMLRLATVFHAKTDLLHIHQDELFELNEERSFGERLTRIFANTTLESHIYMAKTPIHGIKTYIEANQPELLILANTNRDFLENLFHESVIKYFVQEQLIPLLILPEA